MSLLFFKMKAKTESWEEYFIDKGRNGDYKLAERFVISSRRYIYLNNVNVDNKNKVLYNLCHNLSTD